MKGYDGDPEGTANVIHADGWLHTGDLGVMRPDGCIHLTGRSHDVIIRGGENIYPREVEEFLYTHPKVGEVQVVGIPDARLGEIVAAWVRLERAWKPPKPRSRSGARGRSLTIRSPRTFALWTASRHAFGKIQKYKIREFEIQARGLQQEARRRRREGASSG